MNRSSRLRVRRPHRLARVVALAVAAGALVLVSTPAHAVTSTQNVLVTGSTTQLGRITRDGATSACTTAKAYPGVINATTTYNYATSSYVAPHSGCLTVTRTAATCASDGGATTDSAVVHVVIYTGTYDPAHQDVGYLGDQGSSANASPIAVNVTAGQTYTLVAENVTAQTTCSVALKFDLPPETTISSGPTGATTHPTFVFTGTSDTTSFECQVDAGAFSTCASPFAPASVGDGAHTFKVRAIDVNGLKDATPASQAFTVDLTPPDTAISGQTKVRTPSASFTLAGTPAADVAGFECQLDSGPWASCTSPVTLSGLASGSHSFQSRAHDALGNVDATPAVQAFSSCDLPTLTATASTADLKVKAAKAALHKAKKSGHHSRIAKAKKKLAAAKAAAKVADQAQQACAA